MKNSLFLHLALSVQRACSAHKPIQRNKEFFLPHLQSTPHGNQSLEEINCYRFYCFIFTFSLDNGAEKVLPFIKEAVIKTHGISG